MLQTPDKAPCRLAFHSIEVHGDPEIWLKVYGFNLCLHLYFRGLDMSRFTLGKDDKEGSMYDLFAVANHSGTVNFGHYTAFGRLAEADQPMDGLKKDGFGEYYCTCCLPIHSGNYYRRLFGSHIFN